MRLHRNDYDGKCSPLWDKYLPKMVSKISLFAVHVLSRRQMQCNGFSNCSTIRLFWFLKIADPRKLEETSQNAGIGVHSASSCAANANFGQYFQGKQIAFEFGLPRAFSPASLKRIHTVWAAFFATWFALSSDHLSWLIFLPSDLHFCPVIWSLSGCHVDFNNAFLLREHNDVWISGGRILQPPSPTLAMMANPICPENLFWTSVSILRLDLVNERSSWWTSDLIKRVVRLWAVSLFQSPKTHAIEERRWLQWSVITCFANCSHRIGTGGSAADRAAMYDHFRRVWSLHGRLTIKVFQAPFFMMILFAEALWSGHSHGRQAEHGECEWMWSQQARWSRVLHLLLER